MNMYGSPDKPTGPSKPEKVQGATYEMLYGKAMQKEAELHGYSGGIDSKVLEQRQAKIRQKSAEMANYTGDVDLHKREVKIREADKEQANYSGATDVRDLEKKEAAIRKKGRQIANYEGDITVKSLQKRDRDIRKKDKEIANYQGDIVVRRIEKGMHPSAAYRGGKVKNSYAAKERYRKRVLKKSRKNGDVHNPTEKGKEEKPSYNNKESEIWY